MLLHGLKASEALDLVHFRSLEEFRSFEGFGNSRFTPLAGKCGSARAHLSLPCCQFLVQRSFPRILESEYRTEGLLCVVPLDPVIGARVNGVDIDGRSIILLRGAATCHIVEPKANLFAVIDLAPAAAERGWPKPADGLNLFRTNNGEALHSFRFVVQWLLGLASTSPQEAREPVKQRILEESLLAPLDEIMMACVPIQMPKQLDQQLRIIKRVDDYLALRPSPQLHASDLADACDLSPREIQSASTAIKGMSLHRYLRLRRLWSARQALASGNSGAKVSEIARANGFWHLAEFSAAYRSTFGETASATMARTAY
jgi:AraC family ethanolamine operon transcriptional activator